MEKQRKQFGNYFNTREEAEKAVEKLKAWKQLKDKGFQVVNLIIDEERGTEGIIQYSCEQPCNKKELTKVFGGEE